MTAQEIDRVKAYAYTAFVNSDAPVLRGETVEDFQEDLLLVVLENPGLSLSYAVGKLKMSRQLFADQAVYSFGNMLTFSDLMPGEEAVDADYIDSLLPDPRTYPRSVDHSEFVYEIAEIITKPGKTRERFLDFAFGMSLGSSGNRLMRELLFRHRFEVLEYFHRKGILSDSRYCDLWSTAEGMTEPMKGTRILKRSSSAVRCRAQYWKQKERREPSE